MAFPINDDIGFERDFRLSAEEFAQFVHTCENPPPANAALKKLFRDFSPFLKPRAAI